MIGSLRRVVPFFSSVTTDVKLPLAAGFGMPLDQGSLLGVDFVSGSGLDVREVLEGFPNGDRMRYPTKRSESSDEWLWKACYRLKTIDKLRGVGVKGWILGEG